jgi:hypothetical protein
VHNLRLKVHDEIRTTLKSAIRALAQTFICTLRHVKDLGLKGMPGSTTCHRGIGEVADGIDGLETNEVSGLLCEGVEEEALESGECPGGEAIVKGECDGLVVLVASVLGWTKKQTTK